MKSHAGRGRTLLATLIFMGTVLAPLTAAAKPPTGDDSEWQQLGPSPTTGPSGSTRATGSTGVVVAAATAGYPADCGAVSDRPHRSEHVVFTVAAQSRTTCATQRSWMYARGTLYRDRFYGVEQLDVDSSSTPYAYGKVRAIPAWYCRGTGTYTYRNSGYHEVSSGGTIWYRNTGNQARFGC